VGRKRGEVARCAKGGFGRRGGGAAGRRRSFAWCSLSRSTLLGLTSRCMTPLPCRKEMPVATSAAILAASPARRGSPRLSSSLSEVCISSSTSAPRRSFREASLESLTRGAVVSAGMSAPPPSERTVAPKRVQTDGWRSRARNLACGQLRGGSGRSAVGRRRAGRGGAPRPAAISRLYLGCTSAAPRLHLGCISAAPRLHLGCTSAVSRLHLGWISAAPRLDLGWISAVPRLHLGCISAVSRASSCSRLAVCPPRVTLRATCMPSQRPA